MRVEEAINLVIIDKLKQAIVENDMVATRDLLNSVRYEKSETMSQTSYDILALEYIVDLNDGVAPLGSPDYKDFSTGPRISELETWIEKKGLNLNPFAVRASIIKNGTTWYRKGGSNVVTDVINDESFNEIINLSKKEIQNNITKKWQLLFQNNR